MRTLHELRDEMLAVAQGTRPVPPVQSVTHNESASIVARGPETELHPPQSANLVKRDLAHALQK